MEEFLKMQKSAHESTRSPEEFY